MQRREFITLLGGAAVYVATLCHRRDASEGLSHRSAQRGGAGGRREPKRGGDAPSGGDTYQAEDKPHSRLAAARQQRDRDQGQSSRSYVVRKIGITLWAAKGDARHQLRCHPRQP